MIRGFTRSRTDRLGNFWVDLTRGTIRLLLPLSVIACLIWSCALASDLTCRNHCGVRSNS